MTDHVGSRRPLAGEWAVVTGGSKGIGKAIGQRLLEGGANVVLVARNADDLAVAAAEAESLIGHDQQVLTARADVADRASIAALFDELADRIPRLDHFVANAGTGQVTPFLELTDDEVDRVVGLNLTGTLKCVQLAGRMITERKVLNSCIIVVSSIRALGAVPGRLIYAATKAAINQAVRVLAREMAPHGVRVNTLSPGITETPLTAANPEAFAQATVNVPLGRAGQPRDLAEGAYFLCSPAAQFVTGLNMIVDGGESLVW
jgi:NAD(P)-dependent dehydrogenase (short-subunit alcohol dehydrogenase family)